MQRSVSVSLYDTNKLMTREEAEERGIGNGTVDLQNKIKISYMLWVWIECRQSEAQIVAG